MVSSVKTKLLDSSVSIYRSPLRYPGGKQKAVARISQMLPSKFAEYREPLVGGGSVFFYVKGQSLAKKYWINDQFRELVAFWKTVQSEELCAQLAAELEELRSKFKSARQIKKYFLSAREEVTEEDYRTAFLFFFFNRVTFSGTTRAGGFSSQAALDRFTASSIQRLLNMPSALADTKITHGDFESVIAEPGKDVFIFLDPPYFTAKKLYGKNGDLHTFDHERLANVLRKSNHKFLITYDDCDDIRALYNWANVETWTLQYGMNNCNANNLSKIGSELFISNY